MRKLLMILGIMVCLPLVATAQDYPKAEVFTGYTFLRGDFDANFHGWNVSVAGNPSKWFGVVADFGGHYVDGFNVHTFQFGPKFSYRENDRVTPFVHTLVGGARVGNGFSETGFAWTTGGGVDLKVHRNVAVRLIEANYMLTRFDGGNAHNGRLSAGLVWRFGGE
jgi:opacity protein-like surface antigen